MFELRTLGGIELRDAGGGAVETVVCQPKRLVLLAYLAVESARGSTTRDAVLPLFWPQLDEGHSRQALNQALRFLRRELGDGVIVSRGDESLVVDQAVVRCDAVQFQSACSDHHAARAMELYRGDFLSGVYVTDAAAEFEEWIASIRARLRRAANEAAWSLADSLDLGSRADHALHWGHVAVALAPDDERGLRRLLDLHRRTGDLAGAMRAFDRFAERLGRELDLPPSKETLELVESIRQQALSSPASSDVVSMNVRGTAKANAAFAHSDARPAEPPQPPALLWRRVQSSRVVLWRGTLVAMLAITAFLVSRTFTNVGDRTLRRQPTRIAVAAFTNETSDTTLGALGRMAADWVTQGLQRTGLAVVVPVAAVILTGGPQRTGIGRSGDAATVQNLRRATGADLVVTGAYYIANDSLHFHVRLVDAISGSIRGSPVSLSFSRLDHTGAIELLRQRVLGSVATVLDQRLTSSASAASNPPSMESYGEFVAGLDELLRLRRSPEAMVHFTRAAASDSSFLLPLLWMVEACRRIGDPGRADSIARIIERSRDRLAPIDRLLLDRYRALYRNDLEAAYRASRALVALAPGSHYLGLLARDARQTGRVREAVDLLLQLTPDWDWAGDSRASGPTGEADAGVRQDYWSELNYDLHALGEYSRELEFALQSRRSRSDLTRFVWFEVQSLIGLGRIDAVRQRLDSIVAASTQRDPFADPFPLGALLRNAALELRGHGHPVFAREVLERAHQWYVSRPDIARATDIESYQRMQVLEELERWSEASALARAVATQAPQYADGTARVIGRAAAAGGDHEGARQIIRRLSATHGRGVAARLQAGAAIAAALGERDAAVTMLRQSYEAGLGFTFWQHIDVAFESLRDLPSYRDLVRLKP